MMVPSMSEKITRCLSFMAPESDQVQGLSDEEGRTEAAARERVWRMRPGD